MGVEGDNFWEMKRLGKEAVKAGDTVREEGERVMRKA